MLVIRLRDDSDFKLQELFGWHFGTEQFQIDFCDDSLFAIKPANAEHLDPVRLFGLHEDDPLMIVMQ
jgi:hypothetical protein